MLPMLPMPLPMLLPMLAIAFVPLFSESLAETGPEIMLVVVALPPPEAEEPGAALTPSV